MKKLNHFLVKDVGHLVLVWNAMITTAVKRLTILRPDYGLESGNFILSPTVYTTLY